MQPLKLRIKCFMFGVFAGFGSERGAATSAESGRSTAGAERALAGCESASCETNACRKVRRSSEKLRRRLVERGSAGCGASACAHACEVNLETYWSAYACST